LLVPMWVAFIFANSRGGMLAMMVQVFVAALLLLSYQNPVIARSAVLKVALIVLIVGGVLVSTVWVGGERLATNLEATMTQIKADASPDRVSRSEIWGASLKMFAAHPILGAGLGGYGIGITAYHDASGRMTPQEAHNDYVELLSSAGLIGLAIGVWFIVVIVKKVRENLSEADEFERCVKYGALLGLAGVAAHSIVDFGLHIMINALVCLALIMLVTARFKPQIK
jgi:O-antigen ligase